MRFEISQRFAAPPDAVAEAFTDPALYTAMASMPKLGTPEVLDRTVDGSVIFLRVHYRFTGDVSAAVRRVIDPARISWVDESHHDLTQRTVRFRLVPDHYGDRFSASGSYRFTAAGEDTQRTSQGEIKVRVPLVAGAVERAIVSGLCEHLDAEVPVVERWLGDH